jgi:2'-5' RNA ligase
VRCFIAIDLAPDVRAAVLRAQETLRAAAARADVRWAGPNQIHLTLKFLGAVPDSDVPAVSAALEAVAAETDPIDLAAGGLGGFPSLTRPRVLWGGITAGVAETAALVGAIDRAVAELGFPAENRPFRGHLTLGRLRSPRGGAALTKAIAGAGAPAFGSWTATEVVLYESRLKPSGALYVPVSRHPLRARRS